MKRCPQCNRVEADAALTFCRIDGTPLVRESGAVSESAGTLKFGSPPVAGDTDTRILPQAGAATPTDETSQRPTAPTTVLDARRASDETQELSKRKSRTGIVIAAAIMVAALAASAYFYLSRGRHAAAKNSIAVLPFANASGDPNMEYLSDGITESLINSLSQLPNLAVKARSTVCFAKTQSGSSLPSLSRSSFIPVVQAADLSNLNHLALFWRLNLSGLRRILTYRQVRSRAVVVAEVALQDPPQMTLAEHNDMIQTFATN